MDARVLGGEGHRTLHRGELEADGGGVVGGKGLGVDEEGRFVDLRAAAGLSASLLRVAVCAPGSHMQQPAAAVGVHRQAGDTGVVDVAALREGEVVREPAVVPARRPVDSLAGRGALEPDAGALGNGQRRRHRRALHEDEVVAVGEPLHGDAFRLVSDRHPKELANGDRDVKPESVHPLVVVLVGSVVLGLDLEAPREGSGELPVDFEIIEAETALVRTGPRPAPRSRRPGRRTRRPSWP